MRIAVAGLATAIVAVIAIVPVAAAVVIPPGAAALGAAVQDVQLRIEILQDDLGRVAVVAIPVLPFPGANLSFDIHLRALLEEVLYDPHEALAEYRDSMPLRALVPLAGVPVLPRLVSGYTQIGDRPTVPRLPYLWIGAQVSYNDRLVDRPAHRSLLPLGHRTSCGKRILCVILSLDAPRNPARTGRRIGPAEPTGVLNGGGSSQRRNVSVPPSRSISVRGAREHNLRGIDVDIPRDRLVVITGLSGSGKSSLAFDTIYAEGQRRYVESLSAYARQFLETMRKPDVDHIEGLSPAISIEQKTTSRNPRSTVATVTEIYDYLRLLFARAGTAYSPATGLPIEAQTVSQMVDRVLALGEGVRAMLLAPLVRDRKGEHRKHLEELRAKGFRRIRIDGALYDLDDPPTIDGKRRHDIEVVVDRIAVRQEEADRVSDSLETALALADGIVLLETVPQNGETVQKITFSQRFACPVSGFTIPEIEPRLFSFNAPYGACPACDGIGEESFFDPDLVIPDREISLVQGALAPYVDSRLDPNFALVIKALAEHFDVPITTPWKLLPESVRTGLLHGSVGQPITLELPSADGARRRVRHSFVGVLGALERQYKRTDSIWRRERLERFRGRRPCSACGGTRLRPEALCVKVAGLHVGEATAMNVAEARAWVTSVPESLTPQRRQIAAAVLKEIGERLGFLENVGLAYLTLDRKSGSLSGGESQRIRLASQIGSGLSGVLYVLDEPSIGLHQRDNARLIETLKSLRDRGNSVLVVEHDEEAMRAADYLVDLGPGAGDEGGSLVACGSAEEIARIPGSITGDYLAGRRQVPIPEARRPGSGRSLRVAGATGNNLRDVSVEFPLGKFVCVTGVSGSGKSTLVIDTLYRAIARQLNGGRHRPAPVRDVTGLMFIDKIIDIDQSPIGRTPRSNPATYTGAFTLIRDWFAELPAARTRGYSPGRFSFNVAGGRCEACRGEGLIRVEMHFLPDVHVVCDECQGKRFGRDTLEVKYRGKSIADILEMRVLAGRELFSAVPAIRDRLATLVEVGLGYIRIGQPATTLSGGEAQRVKLAKELSRRSTGRTLYILDEPTTGLHAHDVAKLLEVLQRLVEQGNTVIVIEHNLDVIKTADWIIDLGPEGGDGGGSVVAEGTPEDVARVAGGHTARVLAPALLGARQVSCAPVPRPVLDLCSAGRTAGGA